MGNFISSATKLYADGVTGLKRKREESENVTLTPGHSAVQDEILHTPKRKRIKSTSKYIYKTLFLDGENSDIVIVALGRNWHLHKIYLSQSPYFSCMFNGSWKESSLDEIRIDIADPAIDENALKTAFGSLYKDYVFIKPVQVVSVLAAATLLQLDELISQCTSMMKDTISYSTVCGYHDASVRYAVYDVQEDCFTWLLTNLLSSEHPELLKGVSVEMMCNLVVSPDLYVMQVEMDIYSMLKKWMFLQLHNSWCGSSKDLDTATDNYFKQLITTDKNKKTAFLASETGTPFLKPFLSIRWQHLLTDLASINILRKDFIINMDWIKSGYEYHWGQMLQLEQGQEVGPREPPDVDVFNKLSMRCGRILHRKGEYCWRWIGYSYGVDLLITCTHRIIKLKRNTFSQSCPHSVSLQPNRFVAFRLRTSSLDEDGKIKKTKSTDLKHLSFGKDEEEAVMTIDHDMNFPLHISMNVMLVTPPESGQPPIVLTADIPAQPDKLFRAECDASVQTDQESNTHDLQLCSKQTNSQNICCPHVQISENG